VSFFSWFSASIASFKVVPLLSLFLLFSFSPFFLLLSSLFPLSSLSPLFYYSVINTKKLPFGSYDEVWSSYETPSNTEIFIGISQQTKGER
jgi:hypothetical protein